MLHESNFIRMRIVTTISFLILFGNSLFAQELKNSSDLRIKIDSLIKFQVKYTVDSTTNVLPVYKKDTIPYKGLPPSYNSTPQNPMTLIILNGTPVKIDTLEHHQLEEVAVIKVYPKDEPYATAIYGAMARNGAIYIELKENQK